MQIPTYIGTPMPYNYRQVLFSSLNVSQKNAEVQNNLKGSSENVQYETGDKNYKMSINSKLFGETAYMAKKESIELKM
jgi:hypothetical protein